MIECCGKEVNTPFCSQCGRVGSQGLSSLLVHVRNHRIAQERRITEWEKDAHGATLTMKRTLAKWKDWEASLIEVFANQKTG